MSFIIFLHVSYLELEWRPLPLPLPVTDFTQQLSVIEAQHGEQLQQLVETFRKRNAELRKER